MWLEERFQSRTLTRLDAENIVYQKQQEGQLHSMRVMSKLLLHGKDMSFSAGDWVEVKSEDEILATLDEQGRLEALPFMPEMLQYCGKKFRVIKSAHKTCDTIGNYKSRRMSSAVHLEGIRCDGNSHGGCQAACLLFWKSAWLKRVDGNHRERDHTNTISRIPLPLNGRVAVCDLETLARATRALDINCEQTEERYSCQATELLRATTPLKWWDPRHYIKDLVSQNVRMRDFVHYLSIAFFNVIIRVPNRLFSYLLYNEIATYTRRVVKPPLREATPNEACASLKRSILPSSLFLFARILRYLRSCLHTYPNIRGLAGAKTPAIKLDLQPGEIVQVRSEEEIFQTIDRAQRNRGLGFDVEMLQYCGRTFRVQRRVERIINEKTGTLIHLPNDCIILDGVTCSGCFSRNRLFCPRSIFPYWREIWLKRESTK